MQPLDIQPASGLSMSLSAEGLLFAAFSVALAIAGTTGLASRYRQEARRLGLFGAVALTLVAAGAAAAWYELFAARWNTTIAQHILAVGLAVAIVSPPAFGWYVTFLLHQKRVGLP
jgi:hypothetical protein